MWIMHEPFLVEWKTVAASANSTVNVPIVLEEFDEGQ